MTVIAMSRTEIDEHAQTELVGKAVILTDGKAGTVKSVWLDEMHGLRVSIRGHDGKWPVSTIKFAQRGRDGSTTK
jgi:PRC-barrel domain